MTKTRSTPTTPRTGTPRLRSTNLPDDSRDPKRKDALPEKPPGRTAGPLLPRYDNLKQNQRLTTFTSEAVRLPPQPQPNPGRPPSLQPPPSVSAKGKPRDEAEEKDLRPSNIYQNALKTVLGKEPLVKPQLPSTPHSLGPSAVRPKRSILDGPENLEPRLKKTLLANDERKLDKQQLLLKQQTASIGRRPNSAPLKDKDKLSNPKKIVHKTFETDSYASKYQVVFEGARKDPFLGPQNSIYTGPVIKRKVLN